MNSNHFLIDIKQEFLNRFQINFEFTDFNEPIYISEKLQILIIGTHTEIEELAEIQHIVFKLRKSTHPKLIVIFESLWFDKKNIIIQKISMMLGIFKTIYGRQCFVKEVDEKESIEFLNNNHLLGNSKSEIRLGLYFNYQLVALSVWGKVRYMKYENPPYYSAELIKFTSLPNVTVTGGLSKLISYFQNMYHCKTIMTYADIAWYTGNSFELLDFSAISILKINTQNTLGSIKYIKTY